MYKKLLSNDTSISIVGMGYVGLPLAAVFAEKNVNVIGFDLNHSKIEAYKSGIDPTQEVGSARLKKLKNIHFTSDATHLRDSLFHVVAVPTPVGDDNVPNLEPIVNASRIIGKNLTKGAYVVFESTVYPGVTEDVCVPILESESGMKAGVDFKVGYSPERVNPGDKENTVDKIIKIVSGMDDESLDVISKVYEIVISAGVYRAPTIKVAEAAKVIENSQRDVNIAFVNELSMIFEKMGIDTQDVLAAAGTKWNFLRFKPGLVGGHCIGVDPYYLTYKSEQEGCISRLILSGRQINDGMASFVAQKIIRLMINSDIKIKNSNVLIMGLTFKENCPDLRNSKIVDLIVELKDYGINVIVSDPLACKSEAQREYSLDLVDFDSVNNVDAIVCAVNHDEYIEMPLNEVLSKYKLINDKIFVDLKSTFNSIKDIEEVIYWRL